MIRGLGIDIQEINRIRSILAKYKDLMVGEVFTYKEWIDIWNSKNPYLKASLLFSIKESAAKAIGTGFRGFKFCDIAVELEQKVKITFLSKKIIEGSNIKINCNFSYDTDLVYTEVILEKKDA